jgi:PBSX family phage terminase large subunit
MLLSRLSDPDAQLFATTNPDHPAHWLKRNYLDRAREIDLHRVKFKLRDNTSLTEKYIRNITASYTGLWKKRYIDGEWVAAEGAVYGDVWDPDRQVEKTVPVLLNQWNGIDYGTTNPFVALNMGIGTDGRLHIRREWRWDSRVKQRSLTASQYEERLRRWHQRIGEMPNWVFVDPEEAGFRVELQQAHWRGVRAADNSVVEGIRLNADLLMKDKLRIHESCEGLIDEFPGYVWDPDADRDVPIKVDDHSLDAGRYGIFSSEWLWRRQVLPQEAAA